MTATNTAKQTLAETITKPLEFCDQIKFTNNWGQPAVAAVLWHDGDTVSIDYLGCQHEIPVTAITKVL